MKIYRVTNTQFIKPSNEYPDCLIRLKKACPEATQQAVKLVKGQALIEASGGITLANVRAVAEIGVDFISVGALTHSVKALDISLEFEIT